MFRPPNLLLNRSEPTCLSTHPTTAPRVRKAKGRCGGGLCSQFVQLFRKKMVDEYWKKKIGQLPTHVTEFCDGASSQFKCKDSWSQVADSVKTLGFPVTRHFFESSHGKGPHDGAGANVKNVVAKRNLQRVPSDEWYNKVTNAYQFFKCAQSGECLTLCTPSQW